MAKVKKTVSKTKTIKKSKSKKIHTKNKGFIAKLDAIWEADRNWILWGFALLVLLIISTTLIIGLRVRSADEKEAAQSPKANKNMAVMHFEWQDNVPPIAKMYQPDKGYKLVAVDVTLLNLRKTSIWFAPAVDSYILDSSGNRYGMAMAEIEKPLEAGSYNPQEAADGQLSYAIPKNSHNSKWCYKLGESNGGGSVICYPLNQYDKAK